MSVLFIWNIVNQTFFFNFLLYSSLTTPSPNMQNEKFMIEQTRKSNSGAQLSWANKSSAYTHIPVKVK